MTISSHLPDLVDQYIAARTQRLAIDKQAKEMKEFEEVLKSAIISKYQEQGITALGAANGTVKMTTLIEPVAQDWQEIWDYIRRTGSFELLHRRLANLAVKERWEAGVILPGIGQQEIFKLSVSAKS
jgi:hypothetical protein